jgi:hypothetical protein
LISFPAPIANKINTWHSWNKTKERKEINQNKSKILSSWSSWKSSNTDSAATVFGRILNHFVAHGSQNYAEAIRL